MKKVNGLIRVLCFAIDCIIIIVPIQFIMMGIFNVTIAQAELLYKLLFAVYGAFFMLYLRGATLGKYFGKIRVISYDGGDVSLLHLGIREFSKTLYFVPIIGWVLGLISLVMVFCKEGRALHEYIARTRVVYIWDEVASKDE